MRKDLHKVVTERPRRGSGTPSQKHGGKLGRRDVERARDEDHDSWPTMIAWSRNRNDRRKDFSDLIGPLRKFLRSQVGRPWDTVHRDLSKTLDKRTLTGRHIWTHIALEVTEHCELGADGRVYPRRGIGRDRVPTPVRGLYVHPVSGLLCASRRRDASGLKAFRAALAQYFHRSWSLPVADEDLSNFRIDGQTLWEKRAEAWFIHTYERVPDRTVKGSLYPGGLERRFLEPAHLVRLSTKQASRKEVQAARHLLERQPF